MISQPLYEIVKFIDSEAVLMVNCWFTSVDVAQKYLGLEQAAGELADCQVAESASRAYVVTERANKTDFGDLTK
jgi:hypothetical protein